MANVVDRKQWIDLREALDIIVAVISGFVLVRVDPQINVRRQFTAQRVDGVRVLLQADDADAVAHAVSVEVTALGDEPRPLDFAGMIGRPQGETAFVAGVDPIERAGQVRLDGDART